MGKLLNALKEWSDNNIKEGNEFLENLGQKIEDISKLKYKNIRPNLEQTKELEGNGLQDTTNENIETQINGSSIYDWLEQQQKKEWEREDSAYTRMVADMQRAGINPNLYNATPMQSSSITNAGTSAYSADLEKAVKELELQIEQDFQGKENEKDRLNDTINKVLNIALNIGMMLFLKKKG